VKRWLAALAVAACHTSTPAPPARTSDFGFYLLAMQWAPAACRFTLHGLWPNFTDAQSAGKPRAWPQFCGAYAHCEQAEGSGCAPDAPVPADLAQLAPDYVGSGTLATHEWSKHGSCTTLSAAGYFGAELAAIRSIHLDVTPDAVRAAAGKDLARADLLNAFGIPTASVVLGCDAQCHLTQVGFCIAKDAHDNPTTPVPCTQNVTTSEYDNGCVTRGCDRVAIPTAGACAAP
jgi:ribonuclease T2